MSPTNDGIIQATQMIMRNLADPHLDFLVISKTKESNGSFGFNLFPIKYSCLGNKDDVGCIHKFKDWFFSKLQELQLERSQE